MTTDEPSDDHGMQTLAELHVELQKEVCKIGRARLDRNSSEANFPDPARLDAISRRLFVRSVIAFCEGVGFGLRSTGLSLTRKRNNLSEVERWAAAERTYEMTHSGKVVEKGAKLRTLPTIRFSFAVAAKAAGGSFCLDTSSRGWAALQSTLKVRNRLTHPRAKAELHVSESEARTALEAFGWFNNQVVAILADIVEHVVRDAAKRAPGAHRLHQEIDLLVPVLRRWATPLKSARKATGRTRQRKSPT